MPSSVRTRRLTRAQRRTCPGVGVFCGERCPLLAQLTYPLSPSDFLRRHWRRRALLVHAPRRRLRALSRELLHGLSLRKLLHDTPSEEVHVWFGGGGGNTSIKVADPEAALTCHASGGSLYFRAPVSASELLTTALSQQLGLSFGALYADGAPRSEVETFASRAGHVTHWHFDYMENFTLQLRGTKRWRLKRSAVGVPVRGCTPQWGAASAAVRTAAEQQAKLHAQHASGGTFEAAPPDAFFADADEVVVRPGSVLYVPAGTWHRVECDEDSLSINVSLMGTTWADHVADALRQRLLTHAAARAPVCMASVADGRRQLRDVLKVASRELAALAPADLLPQALALPRVERLALPGRAEAADAAEATTLRRGARFKRNPLAVLLRLPDHDDNSDDEDDDEGEEGEAEGGGGEAAADGSEGEEESVGDSSTRRWSEEGIDPDTEDGQEEDEEEAVEAAETLGERTRCGGGERLASADDLFMRCRRERRGDVTYAVHGLFGGEEYASALRVELLTPPDAVALMEWLRAAPASFSARDALRAARLPWAAVQETLLALERNGYVRRVRRAAS